MFSYALLPNNNKNISFVLGVQIRQRMKLGVSERVCEKPKQLQWMLHELLTTKNIFPVQNLAQASIAKLLLDFIFVRVYMRTQYMIGGVNYAASTIISWTYKHLVHMNPSNSASKRNP